MKINKIVCLLALLVGVACTGNDDDTPTGSTGGGDKPGPENPSGVLTLNVSSRFLAADGEDAIVFTVYKGDSDVTAEATIFDKETSAELSSSRFSTTQAGTYKFFASYGSEISEIVSISAVSGVPDLPVDPDPDRFDGFRRHVLITQFTSCECTYCPYASASLIEYFKANTSGDAIHAGVHVSIPSADNMVNESSLAIKNMVVVSSAPTVGFDLRKDLRFTMSSTGLTQIIASNVKLLENNIAKRLALDTPVGISAAATATSTQILVNAEAKVALDGNYRISAWLLEDGIEEQQINGTGIKGYDFDTHNNVVRAISNVAYVPGDVLGTDGSMAKGASARFFATFDIVRAKVADAANCKVLIVVTTSDAASPTVYYVANLISCPVGGTAAYEYLD